MPRFFFLAPQLSFLLIALFAGNACAQEPPPTIATDTEQKVEQESAASEFSQLKVNEAFIELRTGPGRGFPKLYALERGVLLHVLKERTDWFLVQGPREKQGWIDRDTLLRLVHSDGVGVSLNQATEADANTRVWEVGFQFGEIEGANSVTVFGDWGFTKGLALELNYQEVLGNYSDSKTYNVRVLSSPFADWRISPFFALGAGRISTDASGSIIRSEDRVDNTVHVGAGLRSYLTRNFLVRMDYNNYVVLTSRNQNEHIEEWKLGFSVFF